MGVQECRAASRELRAEDRPKRTQFAWCKKLLVNANHARIITLVLSARLPTIVAPASLSKPVC
jgi:hypothetical protein